MPEHSDPLTLLLQILSPVTKLEEQLALFSGLDERGWMGLIEAAQRQQVDALLYLQVKEFLGKTIITSLSIEVLHNAYLSNAGRNALSLHNASQILQALGKAGIDVIGLKGIYLIENLYSDIGERSMSDIDILVRKQDLGKAASILEGLGYEKDTYYDLNDSNLDIKHIPPMTKPGSPPVEVHWTLLEEDEPFSIDAEALWLRSKPTRIAEVEVLGLGVEDLIMHLSMHLTYQHYLRLGLRGLYDIALVIHQHRDEIDWQKLVEIARSWQAEKVVALSMALVSDLLGVDVPQEIQRGLLDEPITPEILAQAREQLLGREAYDTYLTPDLVDLAGTRNIFGRIRLGLQRLFLPRLTLARLYGVPPDSPRIFMCYFQRLKYLVRQYGKTVLKIGTGDASLEPALASGKTSDELHAWMSRRT